MWAAVTRRGWVVLAAVLGVALLVSGYLTTTLSHRLEQGSSSWYGSGADIRTAGPTTELRYAFKPGAQITFGASIRNPGPWPAMIIAIAVDDRPKDQQLFRITRLTMIYSDGKSGTAYSPDNATPFKATTMAAGTELSVFITVTVPDLPVTPGTSLFFHQLAVDYRVLGLPRHQRVPMGFYLSLHAAERT